jgi:hypothetical protein
MIHFDRNGKSRYWRNNLVKLGPSLSRFLDKLASFLRLVCQNNVLNPVLCKAKMPSVTRDSNPAPLGLQSATTTTAPFALRNSGSFLRKKWHNNRWYVRAFLIFE